MDNTVEGVGGEIQLTDAINAQDDVYACTFEGKIYDIGNTLEWLKSSIDMALTHDDVKDDVIAYLKEQVNKY